MKTGKHDTQITPKAELSVLPGKRELVPVTRLFSEAAVTVINGVLTTVRVLKAA